MEEICYLPTFYTNSMSLTKCKKIIRWWTETLNVGTLAAIVFDFMQFIQNIILMEHLHMPSDKHKQLCLPFNSNINGQIILFIVHEYFLKCIFMFQ